MNIVESLTDRELEVISELATGKSNAEIAATLFISKATVQNHLHRIYGKLQVSSRLEAAVFFFEAKDRGLCFTQDH